MKTRMAKTLVATLMLASTLNSLGACMAPAGGGMPQTGMSGGQGGGEGGMGGGGGGGSGGGGGGGGGGY